MLVYKTDCHIICCCYVVPGKVEHPCWEPGMAHGVSVAVLTTHLPICSMTARTMRWAPMVLHTSKPLLPASLMPLPAKGNTYEMYPIQGETGRRAKQRHEGQPLPALFVPKIDNMACSSPKHTPWHPIYAPSPCCASVNPCDMIAAIENTLHLIIAADATNG